MRDRPLLDLLENDPGLIGLIPKYEDQGEDRPRALGQGSGLRPLLDRDSFLEQARRDLLRGPLGHAARAIAPRQQFRIADALGPRKRGASVRERTRNVDLPQRCWLRSLRISAHSASSPPLQPAPPHPA